MFSDFLFNFTIRIKQYQDNVEDTFWTHISSYDYDNNLTIITRLIVTTCFNSPTSRHKPRHRKEVINIGTHSDSWSGINNANYVFFSMLPSRKFGKLHWQYCRKEIHGKFYYSINIIIRQPPLGTNISKGLLRPKPSVLTTMDSSSANINKFGVFILGLDYLL